MPMYLVSRSADVLGGATALSLSALCTLVPLYPWTFSSLNRGTTNAASTFRSQDRARNDAQQERRSYRGAHPFDAVAARTFSSASRRRRIERRQARARVSRSRR